MPSVQNCTDALVACMGIAIRRTRAFVRLSQGRAFSSRLKLLNAEGSLIRAALGWQEAPETCMAGGTRLGRAGVFIPPATLPYGG